MITFSKTLKIKDFIMDHFFNTISLKLDWDCEGILYVWINFDGERRRQKILYDVKKSKLTIYPALLTHRYEKNNSVEIEYFSIKEERDLKIEEIIS
jgi:hypothetical protein